MRMKHISSYVQLSHTSEGLMLIFLQLFMFAVEGDLLFVAGLDREVGLA